MAGLPNTLSRTQLKFTGLTNFEGWIIYSSLDTNISSTLLPLRLVKDAKTQRVDLQGLTATEY